MRNGRALIAWIAQALLLTMLAVACVGVSPPVPRAPGEPAPQVLHASTDAPELLADCGGHSFPIAALDAAPSDQLGPEFDALRQVLMRHAGELEDMFVGQTWRLVDRADDKLVFLADSANGLLYIALRSQGGQWAFGNGGDCQLHAVMGDGIGAAQWWLDPRRPWPAADATVLEILVLEQACASGSYAVGRILPPVAQYEAEAITLTIGVRGVGGTCPMNPNTPAVLLLAQPLGDRQLLDGFHIPAAPAGPPE